MYSLMGGLVSGSSCGSFHVITTHKLNYVWFLSVITSFHQWLLAQAIIG